MGKPVTTSRAMKHPEEYRGIHMENYRTEKQRRKKAKHPIFLYRPDDRVRESNSDKKARFKDQVDMINKLGQIVNVYDHTMEDFEFNSLKIIQHFKKYYGSVGTRTFTIGQGISFRVYEGQKEPFSLSLFKFLVNYTLLIIPIECGLSLENWEPWVPHRWTADGWYMQVDNFIEQCRPLVNMRKLCECIELTKYLMNMWVAKAGDRLALSISNNDFIEVIKRDRDAFESINCEYEIPKGISPTDLEALTMDRTKHLLNFISDQVDLPISVYASNGLFNTTQFREYAVHMCHKPDLSGNTIPYTYPTNIIKGIKDIRAFDVDARGGRKAEITKLNVSDAGTLERALCMMMEPVRYVDVKYECDSRHFRKRYISSPTDLEKLDGRIYTMRQDSNDFYILNPKDTSLIGKTILLKTPITCTHPLRNEGYICSACYGKLMATLNCDVHIGRLSAVESADEIEQKLLSAKHALKTDTVRIEFDETFYHYFDLGNGSITFNSDMLEESMDGNAPFHHMHLEFYPATMGKKQDGESRQFDRSFSEIVIYDSQNDSRITISEKNGALLYLSPEFNDNNFLPTMHYRDSKDVIRIPFTDLIDNGEILTQVLFEFSYRNNELANPLLTLEKIMFNGETINAFDSYDECLNVVTPLFRKGGIYIPDYQTEMLVSRMVARTDGTPVDWRDPNPEYMFFSISKAIQNDPSALTSMLYRESGRQIAGAAKTYEKSGVSSYAEFILEHGENQWN